jgi:mono/diheme cytochrome c family protein
LIRIDLALLAVVASLSAGCGGPGAAPPPDLARLVGDTTGLVERGRYIVRDAAGCGHCHAADPAADPDGPLSGGLGFKNWRTGTIRAKNITPDSATGIGAWSDGEIVRALRTGVNARGETLVPYMPYASFHGMSDRDVLAVARYLRTQPPVSHRVEDDENVLFDLIGESLVHPLEAPIQPVRAPDPGATPEYGEYLARHVALCSDCHTPLEGLMRTSDEDRLFAGSDDPPAAFPVRPPNLTPDTATGIGAWSEADFLRTLRTGRTPTGRVLDPFMPWQQLGRMREDDLRALYRYLRTVPPIRQWISRRPLP